jgi:hypothetical protein
VAESPSRDGPRWPLEWQIGQFQFHADAVFGQRQQEFSALRTLRDDLSESLDIEISGEPIHVILFARQQDYRQYLTHYFPEVPQRRALFIKRRGPGMVFAHRNPQLDVDLRHEISHALLNASLSYVPLWLDEGLAEYFEVLPQRRIADNEHGRTVRWRARLLQYTPIEELEAVAELADMQTRHYRDAWSWVHFLLHESAASRRVLQRFLQDIQSGLPPGPLSRRVAAELPDVRERYLAHFR